MKKISNFGRFYALLKANPQIDKDSVIMQYTDGRTTHLREMSAQEYIEMCDAIEYGPGRQRQNEYETRRRKLRSAALLRIGRLGINTVDNWDGINAFCLSPKIAGKEFGQLSPTELEQLVQRLEMIIRKGGLKAVETKPTTTESVVIPIIRNSKYVS